MNADLLFELARLFEIEAHETKNDPDEAERLQVISDELLDRFDEQFIRELWN